MGGFVPKLGDLLVMADGAPGGPCYYRLRAWEAMGRRGKERRRRETRFTSFPHQGRTDLAGKRRSCGGRRRFWSWWTPVRRCKLGARDCSLASAQGTIGDLGLASRTGSRPWRSASPAALFWGPPKRRLSAHNRWRVLEGESNDGLGPAVELGWGG